MNVARWMYLGFVVSLGVGVGDLAGSLGCGALTVAVGLLLPLVATGKAKVVERGPR